MMMKATESSSTCKAIISSSAQLRWSRKHVDGLSLVLVPVPVPVLVCSTTGTK